jgi:hypothetical protein
MEQDVLSVAVGTLKRMDETKNEEMEAAFKSIGLVESIIDGSDDQDIILKVANSGNFLLWLLERYSLVSWPRQAVYEKQAGRQVYF